MESFETDRKITVIILVLVGKFTCYKNTDKINLWATFHGFVHSSFFA